MKEFKIKGTGSYIQVYADNLPFKKVVGIFYNEHKDTFSIKTELSEYYVKFPYIEYNKTGIFYTINGLTLEDKEEFFNKLMKTKYGREHYNEIFAKTFGENNE